MGDTPRTDENIGKQLQDSHEWVDASLCRVIERECAHWKAESVGMEAAARSIETELADARAALLEIAENAERNDRIQFSVGHPESARAWAHCATKARSVLAKGQP